MAAAAVVFLFPIGVLDVCHDPSGRLLWRVPVDEGSTVDLAYTNSIFNAPTVERFVVAGGWLHLVEVLSTSEAVFEYLRLDPPYERRGALLAARTTGPTLEGFTTRIGQAGQQRLVVDGEELLLYRIGVGEAVRIVVRRIPLAARWLRRSRPP
ncbi:MAG: hypothetical protein QN120_05535 [Armatimonadota bacterium]|nr:hypothetical protein [Armatimonadota bacterium]